MFLTSAEIKAGRSWPVSASRSSLSSYLISCTTSCVANPCQVKRKRLCVAKKFTSNTVAFERYERLIALGNKELFKYDFKITSFRRCCLHIWQMFAVEISHAVYVSCLFLYFFILKRGVVTNMGVARTFSRSGQFLPIPNN